MFEQFLPGIRLMFAPLGVTDAAIDIGAEANTLKVFLNHPISGVMSKEFPVPNFNSELSASLAQWKTDLINAGVGQ